MLAETTHSPHNPIAEKKHDRLGRQTLAEGLAKVVLENYQYQLGYTVAVYGGWGSGKTSVMNMVEEALKAQRKEAKKTKPIIVKFNPWFYGHTKQLDTLFLDALFQAIETHLLEEPPNWENLDERWDKFQEPLYLFGIRTLFLFFFALIFYPKLIIQIFGFLEHYSYLLFLLVLLPTFKGVRERFNHFLKVGGSFSKDMKAFEALVKPMTERFGLTWLSNLLINQLPPEAELKDKINQHLARLDTPVVVFLDDLDRLTNEEVLTVFRLMREVANFKNVAYIVGIDKDQTARAIKAQQKCTDGMEYLEKIVHYSTDLVPANNDWYFHRQLLELLTTKEQKDEFQGFDVQPEERDYQTRKSLFNDICTELGTPRAIIKLIRTVSNELNVQQNNVEAFDYFIITFFRLHKYNIYEALRDANETIDKSANMFAIEEKDITILDKRILNFLFLRKDLELKPSGLKLYNKELANIEPKRYINNPIPYFGLTPSPAKETPLKDSKPFVGHLNNPLVFHFMIDEMVNEKDFKIGLKIIEILTTHLKNTNVTSNTKEDIQKRIDFDFERLISEILVLQSSERELSQALKKCVLESSNFRLLDEFFQNSKTKPMALSVGKDCLTNLLFPLDFRLLFYAQLPFLLKQYDCSDTVKQNWKRNITRECTGIMQMQNDKGETIKTEENYYTLNQVLTTMNYYYDNELPYHIINHLLDFDNPIILERLEAIQQWETYSIVQEQLGTKPEYIKDGELAALIKVVKAKHGGVQSPEH